MEYVIIRIIKRYFQYGPEDIISVSPLIAQHLIDDGTAERYVRNKNKDKDKENGN